MRVNTTVRRWIPIAAVALGLLALGWIVSSAELSSRATAVPTFEFTESPISGEPERNSAQPPPDNGLPTQPPADRDDNSLAIVAIVGYILLIGGILALAGYFVFRYFSVRPTGWDRIQTQPASQPSAKQLREALHAGLSDIDAGGDPRAAVIACWLRLEQAAATAGTGRLVFETPTDLVARVLAAHDVNDHALRALAEAYHQARYAPHHITEELRESSRSALVEVHAQLTAATLRDLSDSARRAGNAS
jgi:hypothetical protein